MTARPLSKPKGTVAFLIPNFEAGGAERVMIRLAQGLMDLGYGVDLLVFSEIGPFRREVDSRVRVIDLGASRAWGAIVPLAKYLRNDRPKVLCSAIFHSNFAAILANLISRSKTRIVITEHNSLELVKSSVSPLRWLMFQVALRAVYPIADSVVCVSAGIAEGLAAVMPHLKTKLAVIGNPVVTDEMLRLSTEPLLHAWLGPLQPPIVLAVGRLIRAKGFDVLIEAFCEVLATQPAKLIILGEGPDRPALQSLIDRRGLAEHVCLYGFVANPFAWMSKADLFVLPSRHEGLPGVLIEAIACGCRVVATDCPHGPAEILEHGKWGKLVAVGSVSDLAHAIVAELNDGRIVDATQRASAYRLSSSARQYENVFFV